MAILMLNEDGIKVSLNGREGKILELLERYDEAIGVLEKLLGNADIVDTQGVVAGLKAQIVEAVKKHGSSVKGETRHAVYSEPGTRVSWNDGNLLGYAEDHPGILKFRTEKATSARVTIRVVK